MRKNFLYITVILSILMNASACESFEPRRAATEHNTIEYTDDKINKEALDEYFSSNEELYPSYNSLKKNVPELLNNVKMIRSGSRFSDELLSFRFSNTGNGFLDGETFIYFNGNFYHLGTAFGGYGVTELVRQQDNNGHWLYFIFSYGSGIHRTQVGVFDLIKEEFLIIEGLMLEMHKDYTFVLDKTDNSIDLYEATIIPNDLGDGFCTYTITKGELAFDNIDTMKKKPSADRQTT